MGPLRRVGRRRSPGQKIAGAGLAMGGAVLAIRIWPLWIWPLGMGLWLVWAGLGPLLIGGAMVWVGWRLWTAP